MNQRTTKADLLRAAELLPAGSSIVLSREALLEALSDNGAESPDTDTTAPPAPLLTARQVAERLNVSKKWVYEHADKFPFTRHIGAALRFDAAGLERWLSKQRP